MDSLCEPVWSWGLRTLRLHTAVLKGVNEQTTIGRAAPWGACRLVVHSPKGTAYRFRETEVPESRLVSHTNATGWE